MLVFFLVNFLVVSKIVFNFVSEIKNYEKSYHFRISRNSLKTAN